MYYKIMKQQMYDYLTFRESYFILFYLHDAQFLPLSEHVA